MDADGSVTRTLHVEDVVELGWQQVTCHVGAHILRKRGAHTPGTWSRTYDDRAERAASWGTLCVCVSGVPGVMCNLASGLWKSCASGA